MELISSHQHFSRNIFLQIHFPVQLLNIGNAKIHVCGGKVLVFLHQLKSSPYSVPCSLINNHVVVVNQWEHFNIFVTEGQAYVNFSFYSYLNKWLCVITNKWQDYVCVCKISVPTYIMLMNKYWNKGNKIQNTWNHLTL